MVAPGPKPQSEPSSPGGQPIEYVMAEGAALIMEASMDWESAVSKNGRDVVEGCAYTMLVASDARRS